MQICILCILIDRGMQLKIFTISCDESNDSNEELNRFLRGNKIVNIEKQFYIVNNMAYWTFCVTYLSNQMPSMQDKNDKKDNKVDYKLILDEKSFAKFTVLRSFRKMLSEQDVVPAYAIFTDAELSAIAQLEEVNENNIMKIQGIGEKRAEKYGKKICEMYNNIEIK